MTAVLSPQMSWKRASSTSTDTHNSGSWAGPSLSCVSSPGPSWVSALLTLPGVTGTHTVSLPGAYLE